MGDERTLYESEARRSLPEVSDFLRQLAHWLGNGQLSFPKGEERITIEIPHDVELEIELEEEDEGDGLVKRSLEIEIEWIVEKTMDAAAISEAHSAVSDSATEEEE